MGGCIQKIAEADNPGADDPAITGATSSGLDQALKKHFCAIFTQKFIDFVIYIFFQFKFVTCPDV